MYDWIRYALKFLKDFKIVLDVGFTNTWNLDEIWSKINEFTVRNLNENIKYKICNYKSRN